MNKVSKNRGFTLIELIVVIAIIAALAVTVLAALNPAKRLSDSLDLRRTSDIDTILTSIHEYIVDNKGALPTGLSSGMVETQLGTAVTGCAIAKGGCSVVGTTTCVDLTTPLEKYLKSLPIDPKAGTAGLTNYSVTVDTNNIVTIKACGTEGANNISASR